MACNAKTWYRGAYSGVKSSVELGLGFCRRTAPKPVHAPVAALLMRVILTTAVQDFGGVEPVQEAIKIFAYQLGPCERRRRGAAHGHDPESRRK